MIINLLGKLGVYVEIDESGDFLALFQVSPKTVKIGNDKFYEDSPIWRNKI